MASLSSYGGKLSNFGNTGGAPAAATPDGIDELILAMGGWKTNGASTITPSIVMSRPSDGATSPSIWVAPCAVVFDATATTNSAVTNPLMDCLYYWDYGDTAKAGEKWAYGARPGTQSKNSDLGIVGGHVYDTPGTYTATLTVLDRYGNINTTTQQIIVTDPDTVFAGTKTICISNDPSETWEGAPAGSTHVTATSYSAVYNAQLAAQTSEKRLLFKCGQSFDIDVALNSKYGVSKIQISSFGAGAKPEFRFTETTTAGYFIDFSDAGDAPLNDIQVYGVKITNPFGLYGATGVSAKRFMSLLLKTSRETIRSTSGRMTVYQCDCVDVFGMGVGGMGGAVVDCTQTTPLINTYGTGIVGFFSSNVSWTMFVGNSYDQGRAGEHVVRFQGHRKVFVAHNDMLNPSDTKHCLAMRGSDVGALNAPVTWTANTAYDTGRLVFPTADNLRLFMRTTSAPGATVPYASGAVEPDFASAVNIGDQVTDNDYIWELEYIRVAPTDKFSYISNFSNIRDNLFAVTQDRSPYTVSLMVQIACGSPSLYNEPIEYSFFEQNYIAPYEFTFTGTTHKALELQGKHLVVRNNVINMGLGGSDQIIFTIRGESPAQTPACDDVRIENNSSYSPHDNVKGVYPFDSGINNVVVKNTLFYAPNGGVNSVLVNGSDPGITIVNSTADTAQMKTTNPGYAVVPPTSADGFKIASGYGVGNGVDTDGSYMDYNGTLNDRRVIDMGAMNSAS
jgi:hypothetical protein